METHVPRVRFESSLPYILTVALATLARAPDFEGFDQWIYVTYAAIDEDFRRDLLLIFKHLAASIVFRGLVSLSEPPQDLATFVDWLTALDESEIRTAVTCLLQDIACQAEESGCEGLSAPSLDDRAGLDAFFRRSGCEWSRLATDAPQQFAELIALLANPDDLKVRLVSGVTRFWESYFEGPYAAFRPMIEASAARFSAGPPPKDIAAFYSEVTGKPLSETGIRWLNESDELLFIPSVLGGPYVQFHTIGEDGRRLAIAYNCRASGPSGEEDRRLRSMFPPLRALADETRLEILQMLTEQELYAQQIVERLGISQPAVSRHLALMVAGGVLRDRRSNGMKFYSVNRESLAALASQLKDFETRNPEVRHGP